jgi:isopentenyl diphosphate isomerase/L-lactate dehydrogenase-like FMN-dependent dehydrogenase
VGLHAIRQLKTGIPIFKPRANQDELLRRIGEARDAGAVAWGIDIDGVSFKTMVNRSALTSHKTVTELRALAAAGGIPFIIKGVMTEKDALYAIEAGAAAIVVSNHGGRVLDGMPGTARVLPRIAELVRRESPETQVFCDGGIRSGTDIFRMLALGADAVLIGRPIAIMAVGHGRAGVQSLMQHYLDEFRQTMRVCGIANLAAIESRHISKFI